MILKRIHYDVFPKLVPSPRIIRCEIRQINQIEFLSEFSQRLLFDMNVNRNKTFGFRCEDLEELSVICKVADRLI